MAEVMERVYTASKIRELITDVTNLYNWVEVKTVSDKEYRFYVDEHKYIKIHNSGSSTPQWNCSICDGSKTQNAGYGTANIYTRFVKCKSGVILQFEMAQISTAKGAVIIGEGTNAKTGITEKVLFCFTEISSNKTKLYLFSNDNSTLDDQYEQVTLSCFSSPITTIYNICTQYSAVTMDKAYVVFHTQLSSYHTGEVILQRKNYYMVGSFLLED